MQKSPLEAGRGVEVERSDVEARLVQLLSEPHQCGVAEAVRVLLDYIDQPDDVQALAAYRREAAAVSVSVAPQSPKV
jgi:hypothetical protein